MKTLLVLALSTLIVSCASTPSPGFEELPEAPACQTRTPGKYRMTSYEISGSCGDMPDMVVNLPSETSPLCRVVSTPSDDNCRVETATLCQNTKMVSRVTWERSGTVGHASGHFSRYDNRGVECESMYLIKWTRVDAWTNQSPQ